jgi:hypothetical protein
MVGVACAVGDLQSKPLLASPSYDIQQIGLTGGGYSYNNGSGIDQYTSPGSLNNAGQAAGISERFSSTGAYLGYDSWFFNGTTTQQIGLFGGGYSYNNGSGVFEYDDSIPMNSAGEVAGYSERFASSGTELGEDAWFFNGTTTQQIGFTGSGYSYTNASGLFETSVVYYLNNAGDVVGSSNRYSSSGTNLGDDCWFFNGTSIQQIGLTGSGYTYTNGSGVNEASNLVQLNNTGQAIGYSSRYSSSGTNLGRDTWFFNGTSTQQIGLTGSGYNYTNGSGVFEQGFLLGMNNAGQAAGYSDRFSSSASSLGEDSWFFNGTTTQQIGLTGSGYNFTLSSGVFEGSQPGALNNAGQVAGFSERFSSSGSSLGEDSWFFNGTTTQQIGLTGGVYSYTTSSGVNQSSFPLLLNNTGKASGYVSRYTSSGGDLGQDSWFFNGTTTQQIGLTGTGYSYNNGSGVYQFSEPIQMNDAGQLVGYSDRYSSGGTAQGQDGWLFDSAQDMTYSLHFSEDSANDESMTDPLILTANGDVLGYYELYNGSVDEGEHAFEWSESGGFVDLGSAVNGGLTAAGWEAPEDAYLAAGTNADGFATYIVGSGQVVGGSGDGAAYLLTAVPEPTSATLLLGGFAVYATRRRRRSLACACGAWG